MTHAAPQAPWASNTTLDDAAAWLKGKKKALVLTHIKPDGDATGSSIGLTRALNAAGVQAQAAYTGPLPSWLVWLAGDTPWYAWERQGPPAMGEPDAIIVVDTGAWSQLEIVKPWLSTRSAKVLCIDHHRRGDADVAARRFVDPAVAAVCQPVAVLAAKLLGLAGPAGLPTDIATPLYLGLATDTGWFKHSNVSAEAMRTAAELLAAGVDSARLYQHIEQCDSPSRLRLMGRALASLELHADERVGVISLTKRDFAECGSNSAESGGFVDLPQTISTVRVAALITEADPAEYGLPAGSPLTKISLRSKAGEGDDGTPEIDVDAACRTFGGGGHKLAAGAKVRANLNETKAKVISLLRDAMDQHR